MRLWRAANLKSSQQAERPREKLLLPESKGTQGDPILNETLYNDVINLDGRFPQFFWRILKLRCYGVCFLLLKINARRYLME